MFALTKYKRKHMRSGDGLKYIQDPTLVNKICMIFFLYKFLIWATSFILTLAQS